MMTVNLLKIVRFHQYFMQILWLQEIN